MELQHNSTIARKATLENYLKAITSEIRFYYTAMADRLLSLPPAAYTEETIQDAARIFRTKDLTGVHTLFIITYQPIPKLFLYDPETDAMVQIEEPSLDSQGRVGCGLALEHPAQDPRPNPAHRVLGGRARLHAADHHQPHHR